jgi:hypothetical protein
MMINIMFHIITFLRLICQHFRQRLERQKFEEEKRAFEKERESLVSSLQEERSQLLKEKERVAQDGEQMRRDLLEQQKCLARERQAYIVRQRLNPEGKEWISMEHITVFIVLFRKLSFMQKLPVDFDCFIQKIQGQFFRDFFKKTSAEEEKCNHHNFLFDF